MSGRRFPLWTVLGVVLVVALVAGSGAFRSTPPTVAQRAYAIESVIRCPSCEDLSVADSTAQTAVAVRAAVTAQLRSGRSDGQIEAYLVDRYGSSIVLDPPARGWTLVVWLVPVLGGVAAAVGLAVFVVRRRSTVRAGDHWSEDPGWSPASLEDQRTFLIRSLADADAEFLAGDLCDGDYLALRQRDMVRLAAVESRLHTEVGTGEPAEGRGASAPLPAGMFPADPGGATDPDVPPGPGIAEPPGRRSARPRSARPRRSRWWLAGAVGAFGAALVASVFLFTADRQAGQSLTGSVSMTPTQQVESNLAQAATDENDGQLGPAAALYQSVLGTHPDDEVALAQLGWLEYETGRQGADAALMADGRTKLSRAAVLDPGDYSVHLYLGTVLLQQEGDAAGAVGQYRQFLADHPPAAVVDQAAPEIRTAFGRAGAAPPLGLPG